jgi:Na+/H+ antiporter NhaD/arsenite permease-like protein
MHGSDDHGGTLSRKQMIVRMALLLGVSLSIGFGGTAMGLTTQQSAATSVFLAIILGTLFFWNFRLAIAFLGVGVLIFTKSLDIDHFVKEASLPVILFLVGMMIIVGALRDLGFFTWIVQSIISIPKITGRKFIAVTAVASALLACAVDEVTSIIFISTLVFQVCNRLKLNPAPYIIICVLCTNIGSAGTMMGNPVGIYIGTKAHLTFADFICWAFPVMIFGLASCVGVTMWWYRRELDEFDARLKQRMDRDLSLVPKVKVPYGKGLTVLLLTLVFIALHHTLEMKLGLDPNSILLVAPLACAGIIMIFKRDRARHYVEAEVDWWTLLFFMLLFAIAGTLAYTGVTKLMADHFTSTFGTDLNVLIPVIMVTTAIGSAFVDNVIFVAAFAPVIEALGESVKIMPLWWALLFGACFGGNITLIGSTANIVALGMLEKNFKMHISFFQWLKIGALSALTACLIAWGMLSVLSPLMPENAERKLPAAEAPAH